MLTSISGFEHISAMPCSFQDMDCRWCHQPVCLVLTTEVYANSNVWWHVCLTSCLIGMEMYFEVVKPLITSKAGSVQSLFILDVQSHTSKKFAKFGRTDCHQLRRKTFESWLWYRQAFAIKIVLLTERNRSTPKLTPYYPSLQCDHIGRFFF